LEQLSGYVNFLNLLLDHDVDPGAKNWSGDTALHEAARCGHVDIVKTILRKNSGIIDEKNSLGQTALHLTVIFRYPDVCKLLLEKKADSNISDSCFKSPLYYAVRHDLFEAVVCLLEHGAEPNSKKKSRYFPLYWAARKGNLDVCKYLIEKGAKINEKIYYFQQTALHEATWKGDTENAKSFFSFQHLVFPQFTTEVENLVYLTEVSNLSPSNQEIT